MINKFSINEVLIKNKKQREYCRKKNRHRSWKYFSGESEWE